MPWGSVTGGLLTLKGKGERRLSWDNRAGNVFTLTVERRMDKGKLVYKRVQFGEKGGGKKKGTITRKTVYKH